ncbi:MAG: homoserine dehydrogenase [Pseudomonadota bacterium]|nr:homoserine dehydrogenase [Pseudomonadota bacterium]
MSTALRVGVAGLGTVGAATVQLLAGQNAMLAARAGRPIEVTAVSARDRRKNRGADLSQMTWCDDARELAVLDDVDVVVELIGGADGIARDLVEAALAAGKHVVTANKALLAHHGTALAARAEAAERVLAYEAAVAGGIPIIKAQRDGLAANRVLRLHGILNGTCNYILTVMRETGRNFHDVLEEAQRLGYAEADPAFDVDGIDAAHKLAILASLAFGRAVDFDNVHVEGIRHISPIDLAYAEELGYRIKLLGIAEDGADGVTQRVHPSMVAKTSPIAQVDGVFNAVAVEGDAVGATLFQGRGAGAGPTASAVVADLVDIATGRGAPVFGVPASALLAAQPAPMDRHRSAYYVRLMVTDRPGVLAEITAVFRDHHVSLEAVVQRARDPHGPVPLVFTTHETEEAAMAQSLARIAGFDFSLEPPRMIRIEAF